MTTDETNAEGGEETNEEVVEEPNEGTEGTGETDGTEEPKPTETADPEPSSPRPIGKLLALGTYQGMTDEEIQLVIDFKVNEALHGTEADSYRIEAQQRIEDNQAACQESLQMVQDVLQSVLESTTSYVEPALGSVAAFEEPVLETVTF